MLPQRILFCGGGIRVISHIGTLSALHKKNHLRNIKEWLGVSAGAFLATLCASGYTVPDLVDIYKTVDFTKVRSEEPDSAFDFFDTFGLDNGEQLEKFLEEYLMKKGFTRKSTFEDIYNVTGYQIRMWATDIQTCKAVEFSTRKTPNFPVHTALRASMTLPLLFTPIKDPRTGHLLIDGGCLGNYPIDHLTDEERKTLLGVAFLNRDSKTKNITTILQILQQFMMINQLPIQKIHKKQYSDITIWSNCGEYPSWNFDISMADKTMLFNVGYESAMTFFDKKKVKINRRWSVS